MKSLFEPGTVDEIVSRLDHLRADSARQWGKMDVAQMLAHCSAAMEMATGKLVAKRSLVGRIIGPRVRHLLTDEKPFPKNSPTARELKVPSSDFEHERNRLRELVRQFHEGGPTRCTTNPHPFFGPVTPLEWSTGMYKHIDHHLKQFGV